MEAHDLKSLLTDYYLIVPEIQREYVWGAKENEEKLVRFIEDVLKSVKEKTKKNVGFLYSYTAHGNEHYIIDGQQRFTSLILLLYVLAQKEGKLEDFKTLLDAKEPTLKFSYNVRPLTEHFFRLMINRNQCRKCVKENIWYTQAFDKDMTITSMVNAIDKLYDVVGEPNDNIYDSLLKYVEFWYFDVQQTSQGEELYISMNSRGEKLTDSEQIKPLLMEHVKNPAQEKVWDEMEEFFFQKKADNAKLEDVDVAINNFIILVLEIKTGVETLKIQPVLDSQKISLEDVIFEYEQFLSLYKDGQISSIELSELYKDPMPRNVKFTLESLLVGKRVMGDDYEELKRIKRLIKNTLVYEPNTSFNQFYNYFIMPLISCINKGVYQHIVLNRDKFVKEGQGEKGFLPVYEYEKVDAINNSIVSENDIIQAETFAFFDGQIHFLYHDMNGNLDWNDFDTKLKRLQLICNNTIKDNEKWELLSEYVRYANGNEIMNGFHEYSVTDNGWKKYLLSTTIQRVTHHFLLNDKSYSDDSMSEDIRRIIVSIRKSIWILQNWQGCRYVLTNYSRRNDSFSNGYVYVINTKRNEYIAALYQNPDVNNITIPTCWGKNNYIEFEGVKYYKGLYTDFKYKGQKYRLKESTIVQLDENDNIISKDIPIVNGDIIATLQAIQREEHIE